jgi:hypothetical protein
VTAMSSAKAVGRTRQLATIDALIFALVLNYDYQSNPTIDSQEIETFCLEIKIFSVCRYLMSLSFKGENLFSYGVSHPASKLFSKRKND